MEYEHSDVNPKGVFLFLVGLFASLTFVLLAMIWLFGLMTSERRAAATLPQDGPPPPRLQVSPRLEMKALRAQEDAILGSYGWADRANGAVRIPIERAMDLLAQRGLPARTERERTK